MKDHTLFQGGEKLQSVALDSYVVKEGIGYKGEIYRTALLHKIELQLSSWFRTFVPYLPMILLLS